MTRAGLHPHVLSTVVPGPRVGPNPPSLGGIHSKEEVPMKRLLMSLALCSMLVAAVAFAHEGHDDAKGKGKGAAPAGAGSWTGEIVDATCYMDHEGKGDKHSSCASKCVANGTPMMLLMADGKAVLLTQPHEDTDGYAKAKDMAGKKVTITGKMTSRAGANAIVVSGCVAADAK